jgi:SAM-dependent methyltransferase
LRITFSFGRNWLRFVRYIVNEAIIERSKNSLTAFVGDKFDFQGKVFIDIGCGSGLFSLSAAILGCKKIISVDVDPSSVLATKLLREKFGYLISSDIEWEILEGSILDDAFVDRFKGQADFLYSWGVLHHTGSLEKAMKNASMLVGENGLAYIALYNRTEASDWWLGVKKTYNASLLPIKVLLAIAYTMFLTFEDIRKGRGLNMYDQNRGMYKWTDVVDWLGGLPYEPINVDDTVGFWAALGFEPVKISPTVYHTPVYPKSFLKKYFVYFKMVGLGCNEFIFARRR